MASAGPRSYAPRNDRGCIYHATKLLEQKNGAFFISRLILASGINLRTYDLNTYDDPVVVSKFVKSLRSLLSESDLDTLLVQTGLSANLR